MAADKGAETSSGAETPSAALLDTGLIDYVSAYELQLRLHARRLAGCIPDTVIVLEHTPCITYGRRADRSHILADDTRLLSAGVAFHATDRGGDVTYHGPGQLVLYAIVDLRGYRKDVHDHVRKLEQVLIDTLASFGIEAGRKKEYPGVWTDKGKIGAIGLRVSRWVTLHGVSLNVSPDMEHFSFIVPCGIREHGVVSLSGLLGCPVEMSLVREHVRASFEQVFQVRLVDTTRDALGV